MTGQRQLFYPQKRLFVIDSHKKETKDKFKDLDEKNSEQDVSIGKLMTKVAIYAGVGGFIGSLVITALFNSTS